MIEPHETHGELALRPGYLLGFTQLGPSRNQVEQRATWAPPAMFAVRRATPPGSLQASLELGKIIQVERDGGIDIACVPIFTGKVVLIGYRTDDHKLGLELGAELLQLVEIGNLRLGQLDHVFRNSLFNSVAASCARGSEGRISSGSISQ